MDDDLPKRCLITGATSGLGEFTALQLVSQGYSLVLIARDAKKLVVLKERILSKRVNLAQDIDIMLCDLSELEDVRRLASDVKRKYGSLDILINNVGAVFGQRIVGKDGYEKTITLNHYSWFLLTSLLLPILQNSRAARIINVASALHAFGKLRLDDIDYSKRKYSALKAYAASKLAMISLTYEYSRRLKGTNISINCLNPGIVKTNFAKDTETPVVVGFIERVLGLQVDVEEGAKTQLYLASSLEVEGVSGKYFVKCKESRSSKETRNRQLANSLWELTSNKIGWAGKLKTTIETFE